MVDILKLTPAEETGAQMVENINSALSSNDLDGSDGVIAIDHVTLEPAGVMALKDGPVNFENMDLYLYPHEEK